MNDETSNYVVTTTITGVFSCLWIESWAYVGNQTNNSMMG